jgi:hypothetical protein
MAQGTKKALDTSKIEAALKRAAVNPMATSRDGRKGRLVKPHMRGTLAIDRNPGGIPVFAYLAIDCPPVAWAAMRGMLVSAGEVPGPSESFTSFMFAGLVQSQNNIRLSNEVLTEHVRATRFGHRISRLRGMYFFESRELARRACEQNWGGHFVEENLVELQLYPKGATTRVDANWITNPPPSLDWVDRYWLGESMGEAPVWELIADGIAVIKEARTREKAYAVVQKTFPRSWVFAEMARLAGEVGSDGGLIAPFLQRLSEGKYRLQYLFRDQDFHDPTVIEKMQQHPNFGRLAQRFAETNNLITPDFGPWRRDFTVKIEGFTGGIPIPSVHLSA